jgi:hypothetical protein
MSAGLIPNIQHRACSKDRVAEVQHQQHKYDHRYGSSHDHHLQLGSIKISFTIVTWEEMIYVVFPFAPNIILIVQITDLIFRKSPNLI